MQNESLDAVETPLLDLRLSSAGDSDVVVADAVSLAQVVQELKQEFESHRLAMMILVTRLERLEGLAERRFIG